MKIRIVEEYEGEVAERAADAVRVLERLSGRELLLSDVALLEKAAPAPNRQIKQTDQQFEYPAMRQVVARARRQHVDSVRKTMDSKIAKVLGR